MERKSKLERDIATLKERLKGAQDSHKEDHQNSRSTEKMLSEDHRINKQPETDNHRIIEHYDNTIVELKKSFERETGLLKKDIL